MTEKTIAEKARVKAGTTIAVLNQVPGVVESLGLPEDVRHVEPTEAQLVFLFVHTCAELEAQMPPAVAGLAPEAALWVFFRKGSKLAGLDMNRDSVWAIAEKLDMRPLGILGIDATWSVMPEALSAGKEPHRVNDQKGRCARWPTNRPQTPSTYISRSFRPRPKPR